MKWADLSEERCSVARTVAVIGDRWTLLVLRDCFLGVRRFDDFLQRLQISRPVLAARLDKLVGDGILKKVPYLDAPVRYEYRLTAKGMDLHPVVMAIVRWGDVHMSGKAGRPLLHRHAGCGHLFDPVVVCSECGEKVGAKDVVVERGPGAPARPSRPSARASAG